MDLDLEKIKKTCGALSGKSKAFDDGSVGVVVGFNLPNGEPIRHALRIHPNGRSNSSLEDEFGSYFKDWYKWRISKV